MACEATFGKACRLTTLLLIGGSGFFGKSILDLFARGGLAPFGIRRVIALARQTSHLKRETPEILSAGVQLLDADIGTLRDLPTADLIIHAAASSDATRYALHPEQELENIVRGVENFCDLFSRSTPGAKLVYCSSGAVYGRQPGGLDAIAESFQTSSLDVDLTKAAYTQGKRMAETIFARLAEENRRNVCIARCFAFVGRWLPRDQHFAIGNFLRDGIEGRPITVNAPHPVYRSYMYADDLVEWLVRMSIAASPACPVYNVGSDQAVELGALASMIGEHLRVPVSTPNRADFDLKAFPPERVDRYVPSIEAAKADLGLRLRYSLQDAIRKTVESIRPTGA